MIEIVKDKSGRVISYLEWSLRNNFGLEDAEGKYVWISNIWTHEDYKDDKEILKKYIRRVIKRAPTAKGLYFTRKKYKGRQRLYTKLWALNLLTRE